MTTPVERDDEDIAIYIDELKSDDPNLKLNAVAKIIDIAKILEPKRTRDELIPYLTEIIEEYDNDDEFLIKLSEQLVELKNYVGPKEHISLLLTPLEFISSIEEPKIRETAVKSVQDLVYDQSKEFYEKHFYPMVSRLVLWENYTSKISGANLIPLCFKKLSEEKKGGLRSLVQELSKDDIPMVRRSIAQALNELAEIYDQENFDKFLKEILYTFLQDKISSVRMKALDQVSFLAPKIEQSERDTKLLDLVIGMVDEKQNWRIRYHLADVFVGLAPFLSKEVIISKMIPAYSKLVEDSEHEVRSNALEQLGKLARIFSDTFNDKDLMKELLIVVEKLIKDKSHHVKNSMIVVLSKNIDYIPESFLKEKIPELILEMLADEEIKVKQTAVGCITNFLSCISFTEYKEKFYPELKKIVEHKNHKMRNSLLVQKNNNYSKWKHIKEILPDLIDLALELKEDHYFYIRGNLIEMLISLYKSDDSSLLDSKIKELCDFWASKNNYIYRVSVLQSVHKLSKVLKRDVFENVLKSVMGKLKEEKVFNVNLNVLRLIKKLIQDETHIDDKLLAEVLGRYENTDTVDFKILLEEIQYEKELKQDK